MILRTILILVLTLVFVPNTQAQYRFDVKTKIDEKQKLQVVKAGLLHAIETSSWASVGDIGEDYSLWITDLRRVIKGDSMYVVVAVELRTKAMFTRGTLLHGRDVGIRYHWQKSRNYAGENINASVEQTSEEGFVKFASDDYGHLMRRLMALAAGLENKPPKSLVNIPSANADEVLSKMATFTQSEPSPVQVMEALLLGDQALQAVKTMIK